MAIGTITTIAHIEPPMSQETTTIEVKVATYQALNGRKLPGDSFDDVIQRLLSDDERPASEWVAGDAASDPAGERTTAPTDERPPPDTPAGDAHADANADGADDVLDEILSDLDLPGDERRLEAVRACVEYLREVEVASRSDFIDDVYPSNRTGVGEGRWWDVVGKQGLRKTADRHPDIEPPRTEGAHNYEWVGKSR